MSGDRLEFDDGSGVGRLTGTLHDPLATPGDVLTVQGDGSIAAAPGGGSMPGVQVIQLPFTFNDAAALADGIEVFTPEVGGLIYDAGIVIVEAFDGTTPQLDIGYFAGGPGAYGLCQEAGAGAVDASQPYQGEQGGGVLIPNNTAAWLSGSLFSSNNGNGQAYIGTSAPFLLVGSQDGTIGGTPLDSAQGSGVVYVLYAPPPA